MRSRFNQLVCFLAVLGTASTAVAGTCWVDDPTQAGNGYSGSITTSGNPFNGTICGHFVHGTGTGGCTVTFDHDATGSNNADCLTLGRGVTINGNDKVMTCPTGVEPCGTAIRINSSIGSGNTDVNDLSIAGCFQRGVYGQTAYARNAKNLYINLQGASCQGGSGVESMALAERVVVTNSQVGIYAQSVVDSVIHDVTTALWSSTSVSLDNVLAYDNTYTVDRHSSGGFASVARSSFVNASTCHCASTVGATTTCYAVSTCASTFSGDPTFIDDTIYN